MKCVYSINDVDNFLNKRTAALLVNVDFLVNVHKFLAEALFTKQTKDENNKFAIK